MSFLPPGKLLSLSTFPCVRQHPEGTEALAALVGSLVSVDAVEEAVNRARDAVARLVSCHAHEVVFTSGGAESNNAALKGLAAAAQSRGRRGRIVVSAVEHPSVLHPARGLARAGFELEVIPADGVGRVDEKRFLAALRGDVALAALQLANDELGTLQPVEAIARRARDLGVPLHVDATAAAGWVSIDHTRLAEATLALTSERLGGPPGVGALVVRDGVRWVPLIEGGLEEEGRRAGSLHPALVAAFGLSAAAAAVHLESRSQRAAGLRDGLARALREGIVDIRIHTAADRALPGHLHVEVPGAEGEALLADLERAGVVASSGSACVEGAGVASSILRACGFTTGEARSCLLFRVTASHDEEDMKVVTAALTAAARRLRAMAP